jgi:hypothetical protein
MERLQGGYCDDAYGVVIPYCKGTYFGKVARSASPRLAAWPYWTCQPDVKLNMFYNIFIDGTYGFVVTSYNGAAFEETAPFSLATFGSAPVLT